MKLTKNFTLEELEYSMIAERRGIANKASKGQQGCLKDLCVYILQPLRDYIKSPLHTDSGFRCFLLNRAVGSGDTSQHRKGQAGDVTSYKHTAKELCLLIIELNLPFDQLIWEGQWCHVSYSSRNRREILTATFVNGNASYTHGIS